MSKRKSRMILLILLIFSTISLGIGYGQISNINLNLIGQVEADKQTGIVISEVETYGTFSGASEEIKTYYQTMLTTNIDLTNNINSYVTYEITFLNQLDVDRQYDGVTFDNEFYSNNDIIFELDGISIGDVIEAGETLTGRLTFKYDPNTTITTTTLNSVLNFNFVEPQLYAELEVELIKTNCWGNYTCQYSLHLTNTSTENNIKDWHLDFPLQGASSCSIINTWDGTFTLGSNDMVSVALDSNTNVLEHGESLTTPGFQITCPFNPEFGDPIKEYNVVNPGEGGGGTGEGGETGGTSENTTITTMENLTVNFTRINWWPDGSNYQAQYNVMLSNNTNTNFTYWTFRITLPEGMTISSTTNCTISQSGNVVTVTPVGSWQQNIPAGGSLAQPFMITFKTDDLNKMVTIS